MGAQKRLLLLRFFVNHFRSVVKKKSIYVGVVPSHWLWINRCKRSNLIRFLEFEKTITVVTAEAST